MTTRLILGVLLAVVASAITATAVVVVGQQGGGEPDGTKIAPVKAVSEWTPKTPPGTPAAALTLPIAYGRFHIVAPETFPGPYAPFPTPLPGVKKADHDVRESGSLDEFGDHDLFFEPPYIPAGWELTEAHAEAVIWDDGSSWDSMFALYYERPEYFYIVIKRFLVAPEGRVRLVANPAAEVLYTLGEIRGVPVVYHRDPLQIHFAQGNVLTQIEAPVSDLDELIKIADALIGQAEDGS
jgi:hypothetical protein